VLNEAEARETLDILERMVAADGSAA